MVGPLAAQTLNRLNTAGCMGDGSGLLIAGALLLLELLVPIALFVALLFGVVALRSKRAPKTATRTVARGERVLRVSPERPVRHLGDDEPVLRAPHE